MRLSTVAALMIITTVLLSACTQDQPATVDDRSQAYYGRPGTAPTMVAAVPQATYQAAHVDMISAAPLAAPSSAPASPALFANAPVVTNTQTVLRHTSLPPELPKATLTAAPTAGWQWPVEGKVTTQFGKQANGIANEGITIAAADGTPIKASAPGEVAYVGTSVRDYGNMVIIRHPGGQLSSYAHAREILVSKGDKVIAGDVLGYVGKSGNAKASQLHFAIREGTGAIDPLSKLPQAYASR